MTDDEIRAQAQMVRNQYPRAAAAIVELLRQRDDARQHAMDWGCKLDVARSELGKTKSLVAAATEQARQDYDALRAKLTAIVQPGALLANAAFNLSQNEELAAEVTDLLRNLSREWDRAFARAAVAIEAKP
jgi:uncharacterized protein YigA (DUF484 family)